MKKLLVSLAALFSLSTASALVEPRWVEGDVNGDGRQELIATNNLADIVFNQQGEIIGWYVKLTAGLEFIRDNDGALDFERLERAPSLVGGEIVVNGPDSPGRILAVSLPGNTESPRNADYSVSPGIGQVTEDEMTARFRYQQGDAIVTKTVRLEPHQFKLDVDVNVQGADRWLMRLDGLGEEREPRVKGVRRDTEVVQKAGIVENILYASLQGSGSMFAASSAPALIVKPGPDTIADARLNPGEDASILLQVEQPSANFEVYGGKNELIHLYQEGFYGLPGLFDPNIWGQLSLWVAKLMEWLYTYLGNWGLVIAAITVLIRLAIWPLMQSQMRYMTRMQFLQPEVKAINEKYKDDPQKKAEATMALYKEHNVNPAGCLPMFIQFPFLIILWNTIRNFEFETGLLWLPDLAIPDPLYILAVLYVAANVVSLYVSTRKSPEMFKQQAFITLIFAYFALTFPAGVTLYWILSTLIGIVQQLLINKQMERLMATANVQKVTGPQVKTAGGSKTVQGAVLPANKLPGSKRQKE